MNRGWWKWLAAVTALTAAGLLLLGGSELGAAGSTLSRDAGGWFAARRYLEARGASVHLHDGPLARPGSSDSPEEPAARRRASAPGAEGVLVLAFPWQQAAGGDELEALGEILRDGGTILLAYSGDVLQFQELQVFEALGLATATVREPPPLAPARWWSYHRESWRLAGGDGLPDRPELMVGAFRLAPEAPEGARILLRGGAEDSPLAFDYPLHRGRVVVMPAGIFSNAWIREADNADFLETLLGWLGPEWSFDEYHHGLTGAGASPVAASRFAWDLFSAHLILIYLLGLAALGRRFGPAWSETTAAAGSTASFLRHLGALHHRLRHHSQAAKLLLERSQALDPNLALNAEAAGAGDVRDGRRLLELARGVARAQKGRRL